MATGTKKSAAKNPAETRRKTVSGKTIASPAAAHNKPVAVKAAAKKNVALKTAAAKNVAGKGLAAAARPKGKMASRSKKSEALKKLHLSKADKQFFHALLMRARANFGEQVKFHSDDALSSHKDSAGESAGMATHMADLGTDNYQRDFDLGLLSGEVDVLEMIDEALQRLEDSEYGVCLDCGDPIPRKRLEAKPYAQYCTRCKSKREALNDSRYHRR